MIDVISSKKCCGCEACRQICPKDCISIVIDEEGFSYPKVNLENCIDCHLCEKVCPMLTPGASAKPLAIEAQQITNEQIRLESSSGGSFSAIAELIISKGGYVFGAALTKDLTVEYRSTNKAEELAQFRGSKYVQCNPLNAYSEALRLLKEDKWVLFSGTPCYIRGFLLFLRKPYDKLVTIDIICHGVPSNEILKAYLRDEIREYCKTLQTNKSDISITSVNFRNKLHGWKHYCLSISLTNRKNKEQDCIIRSNSSFNKGYGANIFLRPSCHFCPSRSFSSGSDFTLGDYWGIDEQHPELDDDSGTSIVAIKTQKAQQILSEIKSLKRLEITDTTEAYKRQISIYKSLPPSKYRDEFWQSNWKDDFGNVVLRICSRKSTKKRVVDSIKFVLRSLGIKKLLLKIKNK